MPICTYVIYEKLNMRKLYLIVKCMYEHENQIENVFEFCTENRFCILHGENRSQKALNETALTHAMHTFVY